MAKMVLEMQHITKTFPGVKALDDVSLQAYEGEILSIVGELEEAFDIEITPVDIVPENFNSAQALWAMVQRLQEA